MHSDPIVVTGMGLITPLGCGVWPVWQNLMQGQSGIRPITRADFASIPVKIAGNVPDHREHANGLDLDAVVSVKDQKKMDQFTAFALAAAKEALEHANWLPQSQEQKDRTATVIGTGVGGLPVITEGVKVLSEKGPRRISPFIVPQFLGNLAAGNVSIRYGFRGPIGSPVTACAAGLQAIGDGMRLIHSGEADVALVGGTESCIDPLALAGFSAARALSKENERPQAASRPYDRSRNGFVLSEGAGMLVIERLSHAERRGAKPLVILQGYGTSADAYHLTAGPENGEGAALAMERALRNAQCQPAQIDYVNGHATSTPIGDKGEVAALRSIFHNLLPEIPISSTKSATGHMLGAAGSVEAIFTSLAVMTGKVPATLNFSEPDPENEDLDFVPELGREKKLGHALCNAFGFGGVNSALVVRAVD
ncbi:beta-ketoacyl-ACP synthase II [Flexibacterium corallicola]|uniref:beta-ketoacyl-ACP synthase II n=1 Tax=Flexibacterium corallicola TaxID=3037259 RepID=UPI0038620AA7